MSQPHARRVLRIVTVLAAALALAGGTAFAAAAPSTFGAHAVGTSPTFGPLPTPSKSPYAAWVSATCATGWFSEVQTDDYDRVIVRGDVTLCQPFPTDGTFTLVTFTPGNDVEAAYSNRMLRYQPRSPTPFQGRFTSVPPAREAGVCAMRSRTDRIACVRVSFPATGPATMVSIPPTDPLVATPVVYVYKPGPTPTSGGFCGSCLDLSVS
jgi:hypothetical protein